MSREIKDRVIYDSFKEKYFKEAFSKFIPDAEYEQFVKSVEIREYAEYISDIKGESKDYYLFLQYILYKQWMELKKYANSKNVKIMRR